MKRITALLICLSATLFVFAQNYIKPTVENFARIIQMDNPTLAQFDTIWDVTTAYCGSSKDTCLLLVEHAVKICENLEDKVIYAQALDLKARAYLELGRAEEGLDLKKKIRAIMKEEEDMREVARMDVEIGNYYMNAGELKTAIDYLVSGMEILESEKDSVLIVHPILAIAGVYFYMGDVERSQSYINKAIALVETNNDMETLANILANQGVIYTDLGNTYQQKADTSLLNSDLYRDSAIVMYQEGLKEAERAYDIRKELGLDVMVPTTLLGTLNHKLGNYKEALALARNGLDQSKKAGALMLIMRNQESIAISELNLGNYNSALTQAQASHDLAVQQNMQQDIISVNEVLYKIYKKMGRNREAIEKLEEVHKQQKTENRLNAKKAIVDVETKYKTAEKEKQILQQKNDILELESTNAKIQKQKNYIMAGGLLFSLLGFFGYRFNKVRKDRNDKKEFAEALIFAQEEERKRIARDLHDGVGQSLLLIKNQLRTTAEVTLENQQMISDTLEEVRSISRDLHPFQLDKFGLTATINDTLLKIEKSTELFITKEIEDIDKVLNPKSEIHLYRTIQEALSNIVKHAQATAAKVSIKNEANQIRVTIQDNGKGFDLELAVVTSKSLGIRTMHERISAIGGTLKIEAGASGGTVLKIVIQK